MDKITKLEYNVFYKLVDVEGWRNGYSLENTINNDDELLKKYPELLTGFELEFISMNGAGDYNGYCVLRKHEYEFFEKVQKGLDSDNSPHYIPERFEKKEKIQEYKVVTGSMRINDTIEEFNKSVNTYLKDGWNLRGDARLSDSRIIQILIRF